MKNIKKQILPLLAVIAATALGGSSGLYIKMAGYSGFTLTAFRMIIPVLVLLPLIIKKRQFLGPVKERKKIWTASFLNVLRMLFFILAFKYTQMANAVVLLYLWPVFALVFGYAVSKKRPDFLEIIVIASAFAGVIIMNMHRSFSFGNRDFIGTVFMVISAMLLAVITLIFKSTLKNTGIAQTIYYQNFAGALIFSPFLISAFRAPSLTDAGLAVLYAVLVGLIAFALFFYALKKLPVFEYSAFCYMEVVFGIMFGILFLGEQPEINMLVGSVIIIGSSFLAQWLRARKN